MSKLRVQAEPGLVVSLWTWITVLKCYLSTTKIKSNFIFIRLIITHQQYLSEVRWKISLGRIPLCSVLQHHTCGDGQRLNDDLSYFSLRVCEVERINRERVNECVDGRLSDRGEGAFEIHPKVIWRGKAERFIAVTRSCLSNMMVVIPGDTLSRRRAL